MSVFTMGKSHRPGILFPILLLLLSGNAHAAAQCCNCRGGNTAFDPAIQANVVALPVLTAVVTAAAGDTFRSEQDAWKASGLEMKFLQEYVNNASCNRSDQSYTACLWAINDILHGDSETEATAWIPRSYYDQNRALFEDIKEQLGPFVRSRWKPVEEKDGIKAYKIRTNRLRDMAKTLGTHRLHALREGIQPDFEAMLNSAEKTMSAKLCSREAEATASAFNAYLEIMADPHTSIGLSMDVVAETSKFGGIGTILEKTPRGISLTPIEGAPADAAGIREGDVILEIDGKDARTWTTDAVRSAVIGDPQTRVKMRVKRGNETPLIEITRAIIKPVISSKKRIELEDSTLGYLKLSQFAPESCDSLKKNLSAILDARPSGLILDLRNNLGGLMNEATCIASAFLEPRKEVVKTKDKINKTERSEIGTTDLPLIVLLNANSASASELLTGALVDHERAFVVGERSFGKGSYQNVNDMKNYPLLQLRATGGYYFRPNGSSPQGVGILPDFEVYTDPAIKTESEAPRIREEDRYIDALPPDFRGSLDLNPTPRTRKIRKLKDCVSVRGTAANEFAKAKAKEEVADYQLAFAVDVLGRCWKTYQASTEEMVRSLSAMTDCEKIKSAANTFVEKAIERSRAATSLLKSLSENADVPGYLNSTEAKQNSRKIQELADAGQEYEEYFEILKSLLAQHCSR